MTTQRQPTQTTYRTALEDIEISADVESAIAQMQASGKDTASLTASQRTAYLTSLARALRLNPLTNPLKFIKLQGGETLYVTRTATDQLAAMHGLNRRTIDGPKVVDILGVKVGVCTVEVTLPNGRAETATATLPAVDPVNLFMKLETKAKRRGTLSILGVGLLTEEEIETIPGAERTPPDPRALGPLGIEVPAQPSARPADVVADVPAVQVDDVPAWQRALDALAESTPTLATYCNAVERAALPGDCVTVWMRRRADLAAMPAPDREAAWKALALRCEAVGHMKNAKVWLKKSIAEADAARAVAPVSSETGAA